MYETDADSWIYFCTLMWWFEKSECTHMLSQNPTQAIGARGLISRRIRRAMALQKPSTPMISVSVGLEESGIGEGCPNNSLPTGTTMHPAEHQGAGTLNPSTPPVGTSSSSSMAHHHHLSIQNKASAWVRTAAHVLRDPPEAAAETVGKILN